MPMSRKRVKETSELVKCGKCGFMNPAGMKFCGNCGSKLVVAEAAKCASSLEGLAALHLTGSLYLLISMIFNSLVRASVLFMTLYIASIALGLFTVYAIYGGIPEKYSKVSKVTSLAAIVAGLAPTILLFIIGLDIRGVVGPAWIIFLVNAWLLWRNRKEF